MTEEEFRTITRGTLVVFKSAHKNLNTSFFTEGKIYEAYIDPNYPELVSVVKDDLGADNGHGFNNFELFKNIKPSDCF